MLNNRTETGLALENRRGESLQEVEDLMSRLGLYFAITRRNKLSSHESAFSQCFEIDASIERLFKEKHI